MSPTPFILPANDAEARYVRACYGNAADYRTERHTFTRGAERRGYDCTAAELSRLIEEEGREGWTYAGREGLTNANFPGKVALINRTGEPAA